MQPQTGFTLIEALMAGVISLLIPAVLIAVLSTTNRQMAGSSADMRLSQIATSISEDIHRAALAATSVYAESDVPGINVPGTKCPTTAPNSTDHLTGVVFCDSTHAIIKGYRVVRDNSDDRGVLQEFLVTPNWGWRPISFSGDVVRVTYDPDPFVDGGKSNGLFGIRSAPLLKGYFGWDNLRFDMTLAGIKDSLPLQTHSWVCRNAPSVVSAW